MFGIFDVVQRVWIDKTPRTYADAVTRLDRAAHSTLRVWPVSADERGFIARPEREAATVAAPESMSMSMSN